MKYAALFLALAVSCAAQDWYNASWSGRTSFYAESDNVDGTGTHTNFATYIDLGTEFASGHEIWSSAQADGDDLRITTSDGTTEVPIDVVSIDTTAKTGQLWFRGDLSTSTDTTFYLYYGNSGASGYAEDATYGRENVYTAYGQVYAMEGASATAIDDRTANDVDVDSDNNTPDYQQTGKIGYAVQFTDGGGLEYLTMDTSPTPPSYSAAFAIMAWVNLTTLSGNKAILVQQHSGTSGASFHFLGDDLRLQIYISGTQSAYVTQSLSTSTWYHFAGYWDGTDMRLFRDGAQIYTVAQSGTATFDTSTDSHIGDTSLYPRQLMDQIMVSSSTSVADNDWISTCYNNQANNSTFIVTGTHEAAPTGGGAKTPIFYH